MKKKEEKNRKKQRRIGIYEPIEHRYYIFSEGEETEPNYINGFKESIESNPIYQHIVYIHCEGTGRETLNVVKEAEKFVSQKKLTSGEIWCLFDKDSFPPEQFNAACERIEKLNMEGGSLRYHAGWSNECFEYWFVLHFSNYTTNSTRKEYFENLNRIFRRKLKKDYSKNDIKIWKELQEIGSPKNAIKYAQKQMEHFAGCKADQCAPATQVFLLVSELARYLPTEFKTNFIDLEGGEIDENV